MLINIKLTVLRVEGESYVVAMPGFVDERDMEKIISYEESKMYFYEEIKGNNCFNGLKLTPIENSGVLYKAYVEPDVDLLEKVVRAEKKLKEDLSTIGLVLSSPFYTKQLKNIYKQIHKEK